MRAGARAALATLVPVAFTALAIYGAAQLPAYGASRGPYEQRRDVEAVRARRAENLDAFVNFDYRGFDTLGEEFIFFTAIAGFALLLRERRGDTSEEPTDAAAGRTPSSRDAVVRLTLLGIGVPTFVFGAYIVDHGQLTPGGGFQGGVVLGTALLLVYLTSGFAAYHRAAPKDGLEALESFGAGAYAVTGLATLVASGTFLANVLPLGRTGGLVSGGTIWVLNLAVGCEVAAGFAVLFSEFLKETRRPEESEQ